MPSLKTELKRLVGLLEKHYGRPAAPSVVDPLELVLLENLAYLANDERRAAAYAELKKRVGTQPEKLLQTTDAELCRIAALGGILPALRARKLKEVAAIAERHFGGNLRPILRMPLETARKALQRFPGIGKPAAEKILLFARAHPVLALDSNGLRVLVRFGFGQEQKNYAATYRSVQEAVAPDLPRDFAFLIRAHQVLRQHGQQTCRRNNPTCAECPLAGKCRYARTGVARIARPVG